MEKEARTDAVSIIVPMHNAACYIEDTVRSVVGQTYDNWELLLVDDCSGDDTVQTVGRLLEEFPAAVQEKIKLTPLEENIGAARARNTGLQKASGRYVAYLDADDIWHRDKLRKQIAFMQENSAVFSFTGYEFADENGKGTGKVVRVPKQLTYKQALQNTTIFTSTVMFDTGGIGRDKLNMPAIKSEDTALWWSILRLGYTAYGLDENLVAYRRAGRTLSSNKLEALRRIWNLYRRAEGLSLPRSIYNFFFWAVRAVKRRV